MGPGYVQLCQANLLKSVMCAAGQAGKQIETERYIWSVTPALMAWPAATLAPAQGTAVLAAILGIVYVVDRSWASQGMLPLWYIKLRLPLTLLGMSGLLLTAFTAMHT